MKRVMPLVVLALAACGGGQPVAQEPEAQQSPADKCIHDANIRQTPPLDAPQRIDVAHIVIKHDQVRGAITDGVTRSREEACLRALEARKHLIETNDWDASFEQYSDGGGAMKGVLSNISQTDVEVPFANAAFSLDVDELSYVVESPRGFHLILRRK